MANTISPNMGLIVPGIGTEPSPTWASDLNASLSSIDSHNHSFGQGVQITPDGLNINSNLTFQNNSATGLSGVQLVIQAAQPSTLLNLYSYGNNGDLYWNDGSGHLIPITSNGSVTGASGTITGLPSGTASASFSSGTGTFVFQQATNTAANIDAGSLIVRYPGSYPTPSGNYVLLQASSFLSSGYSLTLPQLPSATSFLGIDTSGNITPFIPATNPNFSGKNVMADSQNVVVSANPNTNGLLIIRGVVSTFTTTPIIYSGEGFTVSRTGVGDSFLVTFNTSYGDVPSVTVAYSDNQSNTQTFATTSLPSSSSVTIQMYEVGSGLVSAGVFSFIAIGQRA